MLLTELLGVKALKNKTAGQILHKLKDSGITMARGVYGIVLMHPSWDYVIKLFPKDECYMHFLDFCKKTKNPHLPKIVHGPVEMRTFFKDKSGEPANRLIDKFYGVKLEKLTPFPESGPAYNAAFICTLDTDFQAAYREAMKSKTEAKLLKEYTAAYKDHPNAVDLTKYKDFMRVIVQVQDALDGTKCKLDINPSNMMMRGEKIVLIDPYAAKEKTGMSLMKIISTSDLRALTGK